MEKAGGWWVSHVARHLARNMLNHVHAFLIPIPATETFYNFVEVNARV